MIQTISVPDTPLHLELCQRIHYTALVNAIYRGNDHDPIPASLPLEIIKLQAKAKGADTLLMPVARIKTIFAGINFSLYQTISELYCHPLHRNSRTVFQIVQKSIATDIAYEAVWAICQYLLSRRERKTDVLMHFNDEEWWLVPINPTFSQLKILGIETPTFMCVIDPKHPRVLTFRLIYSEDNETNIAPILFYEAIVSRRHPMAHATGGLVWLLPKKLIVANQIDKSDLEEKITSLNRSIVVEQGNAESPFIAALASNWLAGMEDRAKNRYSLSLMFANYLSKIHHFDPLRERIGRDKEFKNLLGYNRDPASHFPALRELLPAYQSSIKEGAVFHDGLHYEHKYLPLFEGEKVTLRISPVAEACAWIYLESGVLGTAWARELRRGDGSYRPNRFRRN